MVKKIDRIPGLWLKSMTFCKTRISKNSARVNTSFFFFFEFEKNILCYFRAHGKNIAKVVLQKLHSLTSFYLFHETFLLHWRRWVFSNKNSKLFRSIYFFSMTEKFEWISFWISINNGSKLIGLAKFLIMLSISKSGYVNKKGWEKSEVVWSINAELDKELKLNCSFSFLFNFVQCGLWLVRNTRDWCMSGCNILNVHVVFMFFHTLNVVVRLFPVERVMPFRSLGKS